MPGDAAERERARVVHGAADHGPVARLRRRDPLDRHAAAADAVLLRPELGVGHAERGEHRARGVAVERLAADGPHQLAEHLEAHVGVEEARARLVRERLAVLAGEDLGRRSHVEVHRVVRDEARAVREQLLDRDAGPASAARREVGQVPRHRVLEPQLARLDERHHRGRGRDHLRQRGHVEHGVDRHRLRGRHERALAVGLAEDDAPPPADEHDGPRRLLAGDRVGHGRVDASRARPPTCRPRPGRRRAARRCAWAPGPPWTRRRGRVTQVSKVSGRARAVRMVGAPRRAGARQASTGVNRARPARPA